MAIEIIEGNLLDFPNQINVIAHSCNTMNIMGGGIAKSIKERYPEAYTADCKAYESGEVFLGGMSWCKLISDPKKRIINLYTQNNIGSGRQVNYEAFYKSLRLLSKSIQHSEFSEKYTLGLPVGISCGLAGGSWSIINSMIEYVFSPCKFNTYLVKYEN